MQAIAIILASVTAAVAYGVVHDQFTARISIEYFTVGHPRLFASNSPTLHGAAWGVIATWWVGVGFGSVLAVSARAGRLPRLGLRRVLPLIVGVMGFAAVVALVVGLLAWILAARGTIQLAPGWAAAVSPAQRRDFLIDSWIHLASYLAGGVGGLVACAMAWRLRVLQARSAVPHL